MSIQRKLIPSETMAVYSAASCIVPPIQASRSASARALSACFWAPRAVLAAKRREQAEIDVHRLERAGAGIDRLDMAAGDMAEERAVRGRRRRQDGRSPSRSAAAKRPASKPIAADST